jgi:hypothetical protein
MSTMRVLLYALVSGTLFLTLSVSAQPIAVDSTVFNTMPDSTITRANPNDTTTTVQAQTPSPSQTKLKLTHRMFSYRRQVGMALAMMGFIIFVTTTTQNWNP